jgi:hypothetical protein
VCKHRRDGRETFIPLAHEPGQRLECDFGHIHVDFPDGRRPVPVLVAAWAYSNDPFALARPTEGTEAILAGLVAAFEFFGRVPRALWWDNPPTVVSQLFRGRDRRPNERYAALASHYACEALVCMPAPGNEKPSAETRVRGLQRQWATPVPRCEHLGALNAYLRERCAAAASRTVAGSAESIGRRCPRDQAAALPLPAHPFDACVAQAAQVDRYQTVRFDHNRYRVPRACAYRAVTVKGYIDRIEGGDGGQVVARHGRSSGRDEQILDPLHYLAALGRRPAALEHAPVLRDWQLPESFARLRRALEARHGGTAGARHCIRVLQLLAEHPLERGREAVEGCLRRDELHAERMAGAVRRRAAGAGRDPVPAALLNQDPVPRPDLGRFKQLLSEGDWHEGGAYPPAAAEQPQAAAAAGAGR